MKNLFLISITLFLISCNFKKKEQKSLIQETEVIEDTAIEVTNDKELKKIDDDKMVGNVKVVLKNTGLSFTIKNLEKTIMDAEKQLNDIKNKYTYESEDLRKNAIESMNLNLKLFNGPFCCTTHQGKHCANTKNLREFVNKYKCDKFIEKD